MAVEATIKNFPATPGNGPGTFMHQSPDLTVIVNSAGDVITVMPR